MSMQGVGHERIGLKFNTEFLVKHFDWDCMANYTQQRSVEVNKYTYATIACKL